jgi:hypothetical protein
MLMCDAVGFVAFATWRYPSTKPPRPPTTPAVVTPEQIVA